MRLAMLLAALLCAGPATAQNRVAEMAYEASKQGIGGIGLAPCASVTGAGNAPLLAQAADWALGYMAGRVDAGETLVEDEPLMAASAIDIATSIATFCSERPEATVLAATRRFGARVFGTRPESRAFELAPEPGGVSPDEDRPDAPRAGDRMSQAATGPAMRPEPRPAGSAEETGPPPRPDDLPEGSETAD